MDAMAEPLETKICTGCYRERPIEEFRKVWANKPTRHARCNDCHNAAVRELMHRRRRKDLSQLVAAFNGRHLRISAAEALCRHMVRRYGGVERLAQLWCEAIDEAMARRPGAAFVLRSLQGILNVIALYDQGRTEGRADTPETNGSSSLATLSDEELERLLPRDFDRAAVPPDAECAC